MLSSFCFADIDFDLIPEPPSMPNKGYVLISANTDKVIAKQNANNKIEPASLTKLMTLFIVANSIKQKTISLNDKVLISKKAWKQPGSRMFVKAGDYVELKKLISGSAVVSGNDATVALAEHIAGSEARFVDLMNKTAQKLGMLDTHFENATGLPGKNHVTTPIDLAKLAKAWFAFYPEETKWFQTKYFKYNKIKQHNRNRLLWTNKNVDGMKTGYTKKAGYCLVTSAQENGERLIAIIAGAKSKNARFEQSSQLLNYGFHFYKTFNVAKKSAKLGSINVYSGNKSKISYGPETDILMTLPKNFTEKTKNQISLKNKIEAPIKKGDVLGTVTIFANKERKSFNIIALEDVHKGNFFQRTSGYFKKIFG